MIARDLANGESILITQEMHAELAAQFAARWGNRRFAQLAPVETMLNATALHDAHYRDTETDLPIDLKAGRPYYHRDAPFSQAHLDALVQNVEWVAARDPYAGMLVSMHHTGLPQNRYRVINSWHNDYGASDRKRELRSEVASLVTTLEREQQTTRDALVRTGKATPQQVAINYRLLQTFDLLSLYFCRDGYAGEALTPARIEPVPASYVAGDDVSLSIEPLGANEVRFSPWPFDVSSFSVSTLCRIVARTPAATETECREAYLRAQRVPLTWTIRV